MSPPVPEHVRNDTDLSARPGEPSRAAADVSILDLNLAEPLQTGRLARSLYSGSVVRALREAIITGRLQAGTRLVESELARQLGISRGPIRSALAVLEGEGLARSQTNGRMIVTGFDQSDLHGLFRVRCELESTAVRWGVSERADATPIEAAFQAMRRGLDEVSTSVERFVELDIDYHRAIVGFGQSRFLLQAWLALAPVLQTAITVGHRAAYGQFAERHRRRIVDAHEPLTEAIVAYDVDQAVDLLAYQMADAESVLRVDQDRKARGIQDDDARAGEGSNA